MNLGVSYRKWICALCPTISTQRPAAYISPNSRSMPGALIMSVTYGMDVKSTEDPFLKVMMDASHAFAAATVPGKFLVDVIPFRAS